MVAMVSAWGVYHGVTSGGASAFLVQGGARRDGTPPQHGHGLHRHRREMAVAKGLTYYLAIQNVPETLTQWVERHIHSRYVFLLLLTVVLLIKGSFMDVFSAIVVMVP